MSDSFFLACLDVRPRRSFIVTCCSRRVRQKKPMNKTTSITTLEESQRVRARSLRPPGAEKNCAGRTLLLLLHLHHLEGSEHVQYLAAAFPPQQQLTAESQRAGSAAGHAGTRRNNEELRLIVDRPEFSRWSRRRCVDGPQYQQVVFL